MNNIIGTGPIYDTIEGITTFIKNLDGLHKLKSLRHEAGYVRKEILNEYILFGRFILDTCGNFSIILKDSGGIIPIEYSKTLPEVLTYASCRILLPEEYSICSTCYSLPPTYSKCDICDEHFSIKDCHDVIEKSEQSHYSLDRFIGRQLNNIKQLPEYIEKIAHNVSHEYIISDNYINTDGGNAKGYKRINKDYFIKAGDKASITTYKYLHSECDRLNIIESSLNTFKNMFSDILNTFPKHLEWNLHGIHNRYCSCSACPPWYIVRIEGLAPIIIGWRKSVINIEWDKSGIDLSHLFESDNVTKGGYMIHAHGYNKAIEYLNKIIPALLNSKTC